MKIQHVKMKTGTGANPMRPTRNVSMAAIPEGIMVDTTGPEGEVVKRSIIPWSNIIEIGVEPEDPPGRLVSGK